MLDGVERPPADLVAAGHRSRVWSRDGKTYVLVSPVAAGEMAVAARYAGVNTNLLADGAMVDPLSGNAVLNGIPVTVEALVPAGA